MMTAQMRPTSQPAAPRPTVAASAASSSSWTTSPASGPACTVCFVRSIRVRGHRLRAGLHAPHDAADMPSLPLPDLAMKQDERAPFVRALERARMSAYPRGEYVEQESFMRGSEILAMARHAGVGPGIAVLDLCCGVAGPGRFITAELGCSGIWGWTSARAPSTSRASVSASFPVALRCRAYRWSRRGRSTWCSCSRRCSRFPDKETLLRDISAGLAAGGRFAFALEEGLPLTEAERGRMPDSDTIWLTPLPEMLAYPERAGLVFRWQDDRSWSHRALAESLSDAFAADAANIAAEIGGRAPGELIAAHRRWSNWPREGRVRNLACVAEKTGIPGTIRADGQRSSCRGRVFDVSAHTNPRTLRPKATSKAIVAARRRWGVSQVVCWAWSQERTPLAPAAAAITHPAHMAWTVSLALRGRAGQG